MKFFATAATLFLTISSSTLALPAANDALNPALAIRATPEISCGPTWTESGSRRFRLYYRGVSESNMGQDFLNSIREYMADVRNWQSWKETDWYVADFSLDDTFLGYHNARQGCGDVVAEARNCWR